MSGWLATPFKPLCTPSNQYMQNTMHPTLATAVKEKLGTLCIERLRRTFASSPVLDRPLLGVNGGA